MKTLLLGMGNPILTDDSVGIRLAEDLSSALAAGPDVEVVRECSAGGIELLDVLRDFDRAIVLDSIRTAGGRPGSWYRFTAASLRETIHLSSIHDANFATALALGRALGMRLPADRDVHIFAVEVEENSLFGEGLSGSLEAAYPRIRAEVLEELRALMDEGLAPHPEAARERSVCGPPSASGTRA